MAIRNIIFDIGNVLFAYNPEKIINNLLPGTPYKQEYLDKLFLNEFWVDKLDRGLLSDEEAKKLLAEFVHHNPQKMKDIHLLFDNWVFHLDIIPENKELFLDLHIKGYAIYILSNFQDKPFDQLVDHYPFLKKAAGIIVSAKEKAVKPEQKIYDVLLSRYKLIASECIFIDDKKENITACEQVGIKGVWFETPKKLIRDIAPLLTTK